MAGADGPLEAVWELMFSRHVMRYMERQVAAKSRVAHAAGATKHC